MPAVVEAVSADEFEQLKIWFKENKSSFPPEIATIIQCLMNSYQKLVKNKKQQKDILRQLRLAMGLIPKSEKGSQENKSNGI